MPITTYEIRWFTREKPFSASKVFGADALPDERLDWYASPGHPGTGTKLREGRLETKLRTDDLGLVEVAGCSGVKERWQKWSAPLTEDIPPRQLLLENGWIPVRKRRWLQVWSAEKETLEVVHSRIGCGALFELTEVMVSGQPWWTVGFEAFGPEGLRRPALERVMTYVLEHLPAHRTLAQEDSMGYPAWLLRITA
ncbi:MAG: hypothetical protein O3C45_06195 [Bacteroidetes bacterium]|nr:hypothetical protein [Bacteroidota bacterium]MDA0874640.1 hypothetical protein [Bacteroidota bacterium]